MTEKELDRYTVALTENIFLTLEVLALRERVEALEREKDKKKTKEKAAHVRK